MTRPPLRVFVSSTWLDLQPERKAVETALQLLRADTGYVGMEYFGSRDGTTRRASLDEIGRSHIYIGIFAARYGSGITEAEYRRARERELPCFIYFKDEKTITIDKADRGHEEIAKLENLKAELRQTHDITEFLNPDNLATKVTADLSRWIFDKYQPHIEAEETATATALAISALHQLPPPPRDFTGRTRELAELTTALEQGGVNISGLQGMGGIGKTVLALKLADQLTARYPDAQFYLDLKGASAQPLSVADAQAHVIRAYHPTSKLPDHDAELRGLYLSVLNGQRALLLMDNANNRAQVEPLIPPGSCVLLVTSRQHFTLPGLFAKSLDKLPAHDANTFLLRIAPRIGEHADAIAKLCGYLPLALRLAASALAERIDLKVTDYVRRLSDAKQTLELLDEVQAALSLSYELLKPHMQKLWRTLAVFPNTFDAPAVRAIWEMEADATQDTLGELLKYSLMEWDSATARYSLHDLARLFAHSRLQAAELSDSQWRHAAHYLKVIQHTRVLYLQGGNALMQGLALFDAEWVNIQAGQQWAERNMAEDKRALELCNDYPASGFNILPLRQSPRERISWLDPALKAARALDRKQAEGWHLGNLGVVYRDLGEPRRAIEFYEQTLLIAREISDRRSEGKSFGNMGIAYKNLGETRRAIELYEQQLSIAREIGDLRDEGIALGNMGVAYADLGERRRAIEFYEQTLHIAREISDRRSEGIALGNMGLAYAVLSETRRAIELCEQQLSIAREIGDRLSEGMALWYMGFVLNKLGDRAQAVIGHVETSLKIFEEIGDPNAEKVRELLAWLRAEE